jgi:N-carbamoylputrescine amidase
MRLALVQMSSGKERARNLERALDSMEEAARQGAELVVYPEIVLDRFFPQVRRDACLVPPLQLAETIPGPTIDKVMAKARELGVVTVFNLYEVDEGGRTFDTSPVIDADGTLLGITRMLHICDYQGFHEQDYYHPGDTGAPVYDTAAGKIGVAICYDRHYPEYMRALALGGADLVVIPQAGALGEWPDGLFEAEVRTAAFQNGYFAALCNRVGVEEHLTFGGESFVSNPAGRILARGKRLEDDLLVVDLDLSSCAESTARRLFRRDRRPELYGPWMTIGDRSQ